MNKKREKLGNFGVSILMCLSMSNKFVTQLTGWNYAFGYVGVKNGGLWSPVIASLWTDHLIRHLCGRWSAALWDPEFLCCSGCVVVLYHVANPGAAITAPAWPPHGTGSCWWCSLRDLRITHGSPDQTTSEKVGVGSCGVLDKEVSFYSSVWSQV